jgi:ASC-1-like (ASCH) protein
MPKVPGAERGKASRGASRKRAAAARLEGRGALKRTRGAAAVVSTRSSPKSRLARYRAAGRWPDGNRMGRGHGQPYLKPEYADLIRSGAKTWEGRANAGWLEKLSVDDAITFKVTTRGSERLYARALEVRYFDTFEAMLVDCGLEACLPGCGSLGEGVALYRSFGTFDGRTYADVEASAGVVAIRVLPLDFMY